MLEYVVNAVLLILAADLLHLFFLTGSVPALLLSFLAAYLGIQRYNQRAVQLMVLGLGVLVSIAVAAYYITMICAVPLFISTLYRKEKLEVSIKQMLGIVLCIAYLFSFIFFTIFYYWYYLPLLAFPIIKMHSLKQVVEKYDMHYGESPVMMNPLKRYVVCRDIARINYFLLIKQGKPATYVIGIWKNVNGVITPFDLAVLLYSGGGKSAHNLVYSQGKYYDFLVGKNNTILPFIVPKRAAWLVYRGYTFCYYHLVYLKCKHL